MSAQRDYRDIEATDDNGRLPVTFSELAEQEAMRRNPSYKVYERRYKQHTRELSAAANQEQAMNTEYELLNEIDTAFAVFNMCGDSPQTRGTVKKCWALVQARMIELRPQSNYARNVQAEQESAYNLVKNA